MISQEEFLKIFKTEREFSRDELIRFYRSVKRLVILSYAGTKGLTLLLKLSQKEQWPVLARIDDSNMPIYNGADPELLAAFIQTIKDQKEKNTWVALRQTAMKRVKMYEAIFAFSPQEIGQCARTGKKYEEAAIKKAHHRLKLTFGALGGVALAGAVGASVYVWKKHEGKEKK